MPIVIKQGHPSPIGVSEIENGINFSLYIQTPKTVPVLLVIDGIDPIEMAYYTENIYHALVENLPSRFNYSYQIGNQILLDPYAKQLTTQKTWNDKTPYRPKAIYSKSLSFDWGDQKRPSHLLKDLIIYEMHVRGFTIDPSSRTTFPGTFLAVIDKIPHLKDLGINAVELMPVNEFNPWEFPPITSPNYGKIMQYWGYSPVSYFSPMNRYSHENAMSEFKQMVKSLHAAEIEVILDVVYNHTGEGNEKGSVINFKAFGNSIYYILDKNGDYANYSGCGNTLNSNHYITTELILTSLRYWVTEMHIDGFRFDLASIFYRDENGEVISTSSIIELIANDPVLSKVKLIAEPWDAAGLYQVGNFDRGFSEWNDQYRDCIRRFIKGDSGLKGAFATRISGSQDLYGNTTPQQSVNFITCHDGFTLKDLVTYNQKHNFANCEDNQDGTNNNASWNCGEEGPSDDVEIQELRERQMRNLHLALMVSQGIPMILMGDEYGHSKDGNNNTWCQDNPLNWFQWNSLGTDFHRFYKGLINFRNNTPLFKSPRFLTDGDIKWHGKASLQPLWDQDDHFIAFELGDTIYVAFNASPDPTLVQFPAEKEWQWIANSSLPLSNELLDKKKPTLVKADLYEMKPYSSLMLKALS